MPSFCASRMEQKIVEVPKSQIVTAFGEPGILSTGRIRLQNQLAVRENGENVNPRKPFLLPELPDLLRGREHGDKAGELRIADPEQGGGAGRLQHHVVSPAPHIGKTGENESVAITERSLLRPIAGNLRLYNDQIFGAVSRTSEAIFQETVSGEPAKEQIDLFVPVLAAGRERSQRQALAQILQTSCCARAKPSQHDGVGLEDGDDCAARMHLNPRQPV